MFMRRNRARNGVPQPEQVAESEARAARASGARQLLHNEPIPRAEDYRFPAQLDTVEGINEAHYMSGIGGNVYRDVYSAHIPFVGGHDDLQGETLRNR